MADTFASFNARVARFEKELGDDALGHAIGKMAKDEARKAASADLGGDDRFSGWAKAPLVTRYDLVGPGEVSFHPSPKSAGPWTVAEQGRHQGNAGGFSGPGINTKTGTTARTKSGGVRKQRARGARKWNGRTKGKNTATDALQAIDKALPKLVEGRIGRAISKVF
jgi:hypothetical protein